MEKRIEERVKKSLLVSISKNGFESLGLTGNISKKGMLIATTELLPVHSEVSLLVGIADDTVSLKGEVVWSCNSKSGPNGAECGAGVRISDTSEYYLDFIEKLMLNFLED